MMKTNIFLPAMTAFLAGMAMVPVAHAQSSDGGAAANNVTRVTQQISDWTVDCAQKEGDRKRCKMIQQLSSAKTKQVVVSWLIGRGTDGEYAMSFQTPTGLLLPPGASLAIDDKSPIQIPFRTCTPQVCEAALPLSGELVTALGRGKAATLTLTNLENNPVTFNLSLKGFTAAYKAFQGE